MDQSEVTQLHPNLVLRIENWANWNRERAFKANKHCASIEHKYRSPQCWYPPEPKLIVDNLDALKIERALLDPYPEKLKHVIKMHYVKKKPSRVICDFIHIPWKQFDLYFKRAHEMLDNRLRFAIKI
jgi:DNA-directed RNA polymerase specialized sigma24 family protein